jgi:hypothetical protein
LLDLVQTEPLVIIIPVVATIVLLAFSFMSRGGLHPNKIARNTALVLFVIQLISIFLIAKEMGIHYLIPLSLTTSLNLVFLLQACRDIDRPKFKNAIGRIALVGLLALGGVSFVEGTPGRYERLTEDRRDLVRLYRHAEEVTRNDVRVDYFFSDSPIYPLCYGNDCAGGAFGPLLSTLYPNRLFLEVYNSQFKTFTEWISPEEIRKKYDHLYFFGRSNLFPKVNGFDSLTFETIDQADGYSLQKWTRK